MVMQFNPYITFDGTAAQAMEYYASILGGTPQVMTFRDSGMDVKGVMHSALVTPDGFPPLRQRPPRRHGALRAGHERAAEPVR